MHSACPDSNRCVQMSQSSLSAADDALFDWPAALRCEQLVVGLRGRVRWLEIPYLEVRAGGCAHLEGEALSVHRLMLVMRLLLPVREGRMYLYGHEARRGGLGARARLRRRMALIGSDAQLAPMLSLTANIELPARLSGRLDRTVREEVREMLFEFGLEAEAELPAAGASAASRKAAVLARAVVARPALLLGDAPFAGITHRAQRAMQSALGALREGGAGMVFSGLNQAECQQLHASRHLIADGLLKPPGAEAAP